MPPYRVFDLYRDRIQSRLSGLEGVESSTVSRLILKEFILFSAEVPDFHRFMMQANQGDGTRLSWLVDELLKVVNEQEIKMLKIAQDVGAFRSGDAVHLRYVFIGAATSIFTFAAEFSKMTGKDAFADEVIDKHVDIVLNLFDGASE